MLLSKPSLAQSDTLNAITHQFKAYSQQTLQEKIFLHTDKSFYVTGEIIWFKIYDVDESFHKPGNISRVAYVELLNEDHKAILQAKISLGNGTGNGSFQLISSLNSGNYIIRAYTNWMKNFSPDFYFQKNITIINPLKNISFKTSNDFNEYNIQFFPEGGNLVNGIQSKVAFKITDKYGRGVDVSGKIIDSNNNVITDFKTAKFGMGYFYFVPAASNKYRASVQLANNKTITAKLPAAYSEGYLMHLTDTTNNQIKITVTTNISHNQPIYFFAQTRQIVKAAIMQMTGNDGKAVFVIDKNILGEGISQFTAFNSERQPVCERLYFKRPEALRIKANTDQQIYDTRKKVNVDVFTNDASGNAAVANMSMSVYLLDSLQILDENNILGYLYLTSELGENIESPIYYFEHNDAAADAALDNLMLTNGWRRFVWEDILANKKPSFEFVPEYEGHIITGKVVDKITGSSVPGVTTYLSLPGQKFQFTNSKSSKAGTLFFNLKNFYGSGELVFQTNTQKDSLYRIEITNPFSEKFSDYSLPEFSLPENIASSLLLHSIGMQVQNVYAADNLNKFDAPEMHDSTAFYGKPDKKYFLDDYTRFTTTEEVMREYVPEISLRIHDKKFHFRIFDYQHNIFFDKDPLVLIDGVPVFDMNKVIAYDPLKIKKMEIVTRKYYLGSLVSDGIISYSTYEGDLNGFQFDPNAVILEYDGLQLQREFYLPVYETEQQTASRLPDFRNLLFWSPDLQTDEHGKKQVSFYTSDIKGKYIAVIQAITKNGEAGYKTIDFDVK